NRNGRRETVSKRVVRSSAFACDPTEVYPPSVDRPYSILHQLFGICTLRSDSSQLASPNRRRRDSSQAGLAMLFSSRAFAPPRWRTAPARGPKRRIEILYSLMCLINFRIVPTTTRGNNASSGLGRSFRGFRPDNNDCTPRFSSGRIARATGIPV